MRFLVQLEAHLPVDLDPAELERLDAAETARGIELREAGVIEQIWRLALDGRRANAGVWVASDRAVLDAAVDSLPLRRYLEVVDVTELLPHPVAAVVEN